MGSKVAIAARRVSRAHKAQGERLQPKARTDALTGGSLAVAMTILASITDYPPRCKRQATARLLTAASALWRILFAEY